MLFRSGRSRIEPKRRALEKSHGGTLLLPIPHAHEQTRLYDTSGTRTEVANPAIYRPKEERIRRHRANEEKEIEPKYCMKNFWLDRHEKKKLKAINDVVRAALKKRLGKYWPVRAKP